MENFSNYYNNILSKICEREKLNQIECFDLYIFIKLQLLLLCENSNNICYQLLFIRKINKTIIPNIIKSIRNYKSNDHIEFSLHSSILKYYYLDSTISDNRKITFNEFLRKSIKEDWNIEIAI